jgi:hypothetical protein
VTKQQQERATGEGVEGGTKAVAFFSGLSACAFFPFPRMFLLSAFALCAFLALYVTHCGSHFRRAADEIGTIKEHMF